MRYPHNPQSSTSSGGPAASCGRRTASVVKLGIPILFVTALVVVTLTLYASDKNATLAAISNLQRRIDAEGVERAQLQRSTRVDVSKVSISAATAHAALRKHDMEAAHNISHMLQEMAARIDRLSRHQQDGLDTLRRTLDMRGVGGGGAGPTTEPSQDATTKDIVNRLELLEVAVHRVLVDSGHPPAVVQYLEAPQYAVCTLRCNERGLSVRIPNVTIGCECVCVGGWSGAACHRPPPLEGSGPFAFSRNNDVDALSVTMPDVVIPLEREELPVARHLDVHNGDAQPGGSVHDTCRNASLHYYLAHTDEFRSDKAIDQFWKHALALMPPYCSTETERVMVVDVGSHVGGRLPTWYDMLIGASSEHRCGGGGAERRDSILLLVEPNPLNLVLLRHRLASAAAQLTDQYPSHRGPRGTIQLVDGAAAHYTGDGVLQVDLKANRNKKRDGNERGYLHVSRHRASNRDVGNTTAPSGGHRRVVNRGGDAGPKETLRFVRTPVHTVASLVKSAPQHTPESQRPVTTISLMKVDAEGMDALVLYGAADVLPMTRIVVFECHQLWQERGASWAAGHDGGSAWWKLHEAVEFLTKFGFESFIVGMFYWVPLTPPHFWDGAYDDNMGWSNCVAVRPGHPLHSAFSLPPPCQHSRVGNTTSSRT